MNVPKEKRQKRLVLESDIGLGVPEPPFLLIPWVSHKASLDPRQGSEPAVGGGVASHHGRGEANSGHL